MSKKKEIKHWVVVPAAGSGSRMANSKPKQYLYVDGLPVLSHSLERLHAGINPEAIIVAIRPDDSDWTTIKKPDCKIIATEGGRDRCNSVLNGLRILKELANADDWVWVHDAARPCVRVADLQQLKKTIADSPIGGLLALRMTDTVKQTSVDQQAVATVDRDCLWRALTPQVFRYSLLLDALTQALQRGIQVTDEAQAIELLGHLPELVEAHDDNIKITRQNDLALAEHYLRQQAQEQKGD